MRCFAEDQADNTIYHIENAAIVLPRVVEDSVALLKDIVRFDCSCVLSVSTVETRGMNFLFTLAASFALADLQATVHQWARAAVRLYKRALICTNVTPPPGERVW
jgi:hypothetical protein